MKKIIFILFVCFAGCLPSGKKPDEPQTVTVQLVTVIDSCRVYAIIRPDYRTIYTTICPDRQATTWEQLEGKITHQHQIETINK